MANVSTLQPLRHRAILEQIRRDGAAVVADLAERLGVSAATIRRDIEALERAGGLRRVHGGAVRLGPDPRPDTVPPDRAQDDREAQEEFGRRVIELIPTASTVGLCGGVPLAVVARLIAGSAPARLLTNHLAVARALRGLVSSAEVVVVGGVLTPNSTFVGPQAVRAVAGQELDVVVIGDCDLSGAEILARDHWEAEVAASFMAAAQRTVLVPRPDDTGRARGLVAFAALRDVHAVVAAPAATSQTGPPRGPTRHTTTDSPPSGKDLASCPTPRTLSRPST